jgi:hypothetical protein
MATNPIIDVWREQAALLGQVTNPLRVPYPVGLKEAATAAKFIDEYWEPADGRPGLKRLARKLPQSTAQEIVSLTHAVTAANTNLLLLVDPVAKGFGDEAREVIDALASIIELELDDGIEEPADAQLAALKAFDADAGQSSSALAQSLSNFAALAQELLPRLVELDSEFDPTLISQANELSKKLLEKNATPVTDSQEAKNARLLRDQLLTLLMQRVRTVRSVAAHVFRKHPTVLRQVTSAYQRRQRAERRAQQKAKPAEG